MSDCSYLYLSYLFLIQLLSGPEWVRAPCTTNAQEQKGCTSCFRIRFHRPWPNQTCSKIVEHVGGAVSSASDRPIVFLRRFLFFRISSERARACSAGSSPTASSLCYATLPNFRRLMHMPPASCITVRSIASPAPCSAGVSMPPGNTDCIRLRASVAERLAQRFQNLFRSESRMYVCMALHRDILFVFRLVSMG